MTDPNPSGRAVEEEPAIRHSVLLRRFLTSLIPLGLFIWLLHAGALPLLPRLEELRKADRSAILLYTLIWGFCLWIRAARWSWLLRPVARVPWGAATRISLLGTGALLIFPLRTGEFVRPWMLRKYRVPFVTSATTVGVERVLDGLLVGLLLLFALSIDPGHVAEASPLVRGAARSALAGFASVLFLLILVSRQPERLRSWAGHVLQRVSPRMAPHVTNTMARIGQGLACLRDWKSFVCFLVNSVLFWGLYVWGMVVILRGCGLGEMGCVQACAVTGILALGFMLPAPPGFFGAFQASFYAGLLVYLPSHQVATTGAVVVFLTYAVQITLALVVACVSWVWERRASPNY